MKATFGAGCFWGVEEAFRQIPGVLDAASGYMGGHQDHPSYEDVCTGLTGHAEAVQVEYDPLKVSYDRLLETFWEIHDPTSTNEQGSDIGDQYRSVIFYHDPGQRAAAKAFKARLDDSGVFPRSIVTEIVPASTWWRAEEYHQRFFQKNGGHGCEI